jgi:hypothetical protein
VRDERCDREPFGDLAGLPVDRDLHHAARGPHLDGGVNGV